MSDTNRLFVAIPISSDVMTAAVDLIGQCRRTGTDVRWLKEESIHLTLMFLGDVPTRDITKVGAMLVESTAPFEPFTVRCRGVGAFPSLRNPRVWWLGIDEEELLADLATAVRNRLQGIGTGGDTRGGFKPHLTLGRTRSPRGSKEALAVLEPMKDRFFGEIPVGAVQLMKSSLQPQGAIHSVVLSVPLKKGQPVEC